jgi:hypothetical protein
VMEMVHCIVLAKADTMPSLECSFDCWFFSSPSSLLLSFFFAQADLQERFNIIGGVPRYLWDHSAIELKDLWVELCSKQLEWDGSLRQLFATRVIDSPSAHDAIHRIFHVVPDVTLKKYTIEVCSRDVAYMLVEIARTKSDHDVYNFLNTEQPSEPT